VIDAVHPIRLADPSGEALFFYRLRINPQGASDLDIERIVADLEQEETASGKATNP
jgi:hypothetical protein